METLYSNEVRNYFRTRAWPSGLQWEVKEFVEPEPHLRLIFFRDNWLTLSTDAQIQTTGIVKEIMFKMWADGVPTYTGKMEYAGKD